MSLTDQKIKAMKAKEKPYKEFDGDGLHIYVTTKGVKKWRIKYYYRKKEGVLTIGEYPHVSLRDARAKLLEVKELLTKDINPAQRKQADYGIDFKTMSEEWLAAQTNKWTDRYRQTNIYRLNHYIYPVFGKFPVKEISPQDVLAFLRKFESAGKNVITRRLLGTMSLIFRFGIACNYCSSDPCRDLKGALAYHKETPRPAVTNPKEVARLMKAISAYPAGITVRNALMFTAYTFCRSNEVRRAEWSEIDFEKKIWVIPAEKMKMRREHKVPLSRQCLEILENQRGFSDTWVFPSLRSGKPLSDATLLVALRTLGFDKKEMCVHGFRAMASTLLNEQGYRPDLIEISLAHGDENKVRAAYNRAEYMDERRKLMQEYADYLDSLIDDKNS